MSKVLKVFDIGYRNTWQIQDKRAKVRHFQHVSQLCNVDVEIFVNVRLKEKKMKKKKKKKKKKTLNSDGTLIRGRRLTLTTVAVLAGTRTVVLA